MAAVQGLSTAQLLQLDPDTLLATRSLAECVQVWVMVIIIILILSVIVNVISQVGQQLGREVDKKREELRVMVGERYRDLIEAADTIQVTKIMT